MPTIDDAMDRLSRAFELAYFLHRDESVARHIVLDALSRLARAVSRQRRRDYYRPQKSRYKVSMSRVQLLQQLLYQASESHEKYLESPGAEGSRPEEEDLVVWFVKHLVQITVPRNSFYVTLALCRLLYRYETSETMAIYDLLTQDPECSREGN